MLTEQEWFKILRLVTQRYGEDAASYAMLKVILKEPENPERYASRVARNFKFNEKRRKFNKWEDLGDKIYRSLTSKFPLPDRVAVARECLNSLPLSVVFDVFCGRVRGNANLSRLRARSRQRVSRF
jgi:hypothetical protein